MSTTRRLYARELGTEGGELTLDATATRHAKVLRLGVGDPVILFDGRGNEAKATVVQSSDGLVCRIEKRIERREQRALLVLCQCLPKGGKLDDIVRAATELGVSAVHPVSSERSVPRPPAERAMGKLDRLERIAREASRQSLRSDVPDVLAPAPFDEVLARAPADAARLMFVPREGAELDVVCPRDASSVWLLIGPEGGLSPIEIERARSAGFAAVDLGAGVLRVETAAVAALALVAHRVGLLAPRRRAEDRVER